MTVKQYGADAALGLADRIWPRYQEAFGDFDDSGTWYADLFARHAARDGYRLVASGADGPAVTGFAWGYVGQRGQFWTDLAVQALPPGVAGEWAGGHFEFAELAVGREHRRHGLGGQLHDALLAGIRRRCLLSTTDDPADPAVRLYLGRGWRKLGLLRPGVQVMGRRV
jgi:ribosomal protein S18 acetylase RimI-like enzyme